MTNQNAPLSAPEIDAHLDAILRASGSALRNYSLPGYLESMRAAVRTVASDAVSKLHAPVARPPVCAPTWEEVKEANSVLASYSWNSNGEGGGVTATERKLAAALLRVAGVDWSPNGDPVYALGTPVADERAQHRNEGFSSLSLWWTMIEAEAELIGKPIKDDRPILSFMGSGASHQVTAGDIRAALASAPVAGEAQPADITSRRLSGVLSMDGASLHMQPDGSGQIIVAENDFTLEDDRDEGPDGPQGSVHWVARLPASEIAALRDFLTGHARPSDDALWDQTLAERDEYHDMADKLADAIADHLLVEIGEHSSSNCPWMRALDAIRNAAPQASEAVGDASDMDDLRSRVMAAIHDCAALKPEDDESWDEWYCAAFDLLGSRVGEIFRVALSAQPADKPAISSPSSAGNPCPAPVPAYPETGNSHTDGGAVYG